MTFTYNDIRLTYNSTLSTYNGAEYSLPVNALDNVAISENYTKIALDLISVFETLNLSDFVTVAINNLGDVNTVDSILISELSLREMVSTISKYDSINISDNANRELVSNVAGSDQILLSENIKTMEQSFLFVNDRLNLSEDIRTTATLANIITNNTVNISEDQHPNLQSNIHSSEQINSTEYINTESFRFSPSDINPVGRVRQSRPDDGKLAGFL